MHAQTIRAWTWTHKWSSLISTLFLLMLWMKPDYIELLWKDPMGVKMSIGAIVLMIIGSYAIKKIIDIKI